MSVFKYSTSVDLDKTQKGQAVAAMVRRFGYVGGDFHFRLVADECFEVTNGDHELTFSFSRKNGIRRLRVLSVDGEKLA